MAERQRTERNGLQLYMELTDTVESEKAEEIQTQKHALPVASMHMTMAARR